MKTFLLLALAGGLTVGTAAAQTVKSKYRTPHTEKGTAGMTKPTVIKRKQSFSHSSESGAPKNANHAHFRRDNHPPTLNIHPHDPGRFTKVKANKPYKFAKGR